VRAVPVPPPQAAAIARRRAQVADPHHRPRRESCKSPTLYDCVTVVVSVSCFRFSFFVFVYYLYL
jgi:hypothetical protein